MVKQILSEAQVCEVYVVPGNVDNRQPVTRLRSQGVKFRFRSSKSLLMKIIVVEIAKFVHKVRKKEVNLWELKLYVEK